MNTSRSSAAFLLLLGVFVIFFSAFLAWADFEELLPIGAAAEKVSGVLPWNREPEWREVKKAAHPEPETTVWTETETDRDGSAYARLEAESTFTAFDECIFTYTGIENGCCTSRPDGGYVICTFSSGAQVKAVGTDGDRLVIHCGEGTYGYASAEDFREGELYAALDHALDLRSLIPDALFAMTWCREDNMTGRSLYPAIPLLEEQTALKLRAAAEEFAEKGYRLIVYDAYRPSSAQAAIYEKVKDPVYVVDPHETYSWHNVGKAVDISLMDMNTVEEVELPAPVYCFEERSSRKQYGQWTDEARANVELMTEVMERCGFSSVESEWWHYEIPVRSETEMEVRLDYSSIVYEPAS